MTANSRKTTPQPMPDREILNIDGAAALLGVSVKTFSKVLRQGDVPGRKVGREWKFSRQALIDWVGKSKSRHFMESESGVMPAPERPARSGGSSRRQGDGFSVDNM
ncbi:MAG: helix-turn-helix domain-containing protein [Planctomycetota bacterium]|nr:helix-turn-helix domain-containing protein [Planctomycetota bacterium]